MSTSHVHTFLDAYFVQRVAMDARDCDQCRHQANQLVDVRHCHCRPCVLQRETAELEPDYSCHCGSDVCLRHGTSPDTSDHFPSTEDADGF